MESDSAPNFQFLACRVLKLLPSPDLVLYPPRLQAGGELTDFIIVLRTSDAVKTFSGNMHLSVGAGLSAAVGIVGRAFEADFRAGDGGYAACYTYSCSKGMFYVGAYLLTEKHCWRSQKIMFSPNCLFLSHCFYLYMAASWPF